MSEDYSAEVWRAIPGHEGRYNVSDYGRVKSLTRVVRKGRAHRTIKELILKGTLNSDGYPVVAISAAPHITPRVQCIHKLVLLAFVGPRPKGLQIAHADGTKTNNRLDNLRYATAKENGEDKRRHGRGRGESNGHSRLTEAMVRDCRARYAAKTDTQRALAVEYGVCFSTISCVIRGKTWDWVD